MNGQVFDNPHSISFCIDGVANVNGSHTIGTGIAIALICISSQLASAASPESVEWHKDLNKARKIAVEAERPILLYITANQCFYCVKMKKGTFQDPKIVDAIEEGFVPAMVNASVHPKWVRQLKVAAYPTTLIVSPENWRVIGMQAGYQSPAELKRWLADINKTARKSGDSVTK